jgi:hypothetical protein
MVELLMACVACRADAQSTFCEECLALGYRALIRRYALTSTSANPVEMAQEIMSHPRFPVAGQAHHPLVASVLVAAYRNAGGDVTDAQIETAIERADTIPGGFCAGFGADAAAIACGIAVSVIHGTTVKAEHATARSLAHMLTGQAMLMIANNHGARCCKRSTYSVLELASHFFTAAMGAKLATPRGRVECPFPEQNKLCNREDCKYYPTDAPAVREPRLAVLS